ncbi:hypothetical protein [Nonomuraea sp. NPDC049480]|uniref:hypothetical protein n=1 Tax=Nonomuraea sp. NPDC049480 TaxID=3364353 RepID=UPI0037965512
MFTILDGRGKPPHIGEATQISQRLRRTTVSGVQALPRPTQRWRSRRNARRVVPADLAFPCRLRGEECRWPDRFCKAREGRIDRTYAYLLVDHLRRLEFRV